MPRVMIIPPYLKFLDVVVKDIIGENRDLSQINIIFTHNRSIHFFNYYLSKYIDKPCILGKMFGFEDWIKDLFFEYGGDLAGYITLNEMEQAYAAYIAAMEELPPKYHQGFGEFFYWACELAKLFRELDLEMVTPKDILYPPVERVGKRGAILLERLGALYKRYNDYLMDNRFITHPKKLRFLAQLDDIEMEGNFYFVGFFALTKAESNLFKKFYENDSVFYWQADFENLPRIYRDWINQWDIKDLGEVAVEAPCHKREITFIDSHDLHTELKEVKEKLLSLKDKLSGPDGLAIIVPNPNALIPLLFNIPEDLEVNITMGYPFQLSGIFVLMDLLFKMILKKDTTYGYPTYEFMKLLRGPYLREFDELSTFLKCLDQFQDPFITRDEAMSLIGSFSDEIMEMGKNPHLIYEVVEEFFEKIIRSFEKSHSLRELGKAIGVLLDFIKFHFNNLELMEKEFVFYLMGAIEDYFSMSIFSDEVVSTQELYSIARKIMTTLRVPFEGEPICGIQIMGVLESRDLGFHHLIIIDANEGILPAVPTPSPLLPLEIRESMGFPTRGKEESIYAYHFERLVKSSEEVTLLYQNKMVSSGSLEGKRTRSRFIEKLIWEFEKETHELIKGPDVSVKTKEYIVNLKKSSGNLIIPGRTDIFLEKSEDLKENIASTITHISPTMLNLYIKCPKHFLYKYILKLQTRQEPDDISLNELGTIIHTTLELFFKRSIKRNHLINKDKLNFNLLEEIFLSLFNENPIFKKISRSKKDMLIVSAKYRLNNFFENLPGKTEILALEKEIKSNILVGEKKFIIQGKIDRIDKRDQYTYILDYKTGRIPDKGNIFREFELPSIDDIDGFFELYRFLKDIQLPFYIYLYGKQHGNFKDIIGGFVDLSRDGREVVWVDTRRLKPESLERYHNFFKHDFPEILGFLIYHMIDGPIFGPVDTNFCEFCVYKINCINSN